MALLGRTFDDDAIATTEARNVSVFDSGNLDRARGRNDGFAERKA